MTEERTPQQPIEPEAFYTLKEVRNYLRISDATARRWVKQGRLRARKFGRDYRVRGEDVLEGLPSERSWGEVKFLGPNSKLLALMGIGASGHSDISERHDEYLTEIYAEKKAQPKP
jgi:excisionase family DNA binding protein